MLQHTSTDTFSQDVLNSDLPVLLDFYAPWCQPCKTITPALEAIAEKYEGKVRVLKVDIDAHPELGARYGVRGLPTLVVFEKGEVKEMRGGVQTMPKIEAMLA